MLKLQFGKDLLTEDKTLDAQHEAMFAWGRKILSSSKETSIGDLTRAINFLGTYVRFHFAAEEYMMDKMNYEKSKQHRNQHDVLRGLVKEIQQEAAGGQPVARLEARVHALFQSWYIYHIQEWDKPLAQFLRNIQAAGGDQEWPSVERLIDANKITLGDDEIDLSAIRVVAQERWKTTKRRR